ncbi:hypothetical protein [Lacrimispora sp.]|uniref:hypothetical protein n=1 Tax=Lacrimispora sp. TaxID=2719234 RepID=UPI003991A673
MKVWITKYALTSGIKEMEVEQSEDFPDIVKGKTWNDSYHGDGREWHRTYESAIAKAEEMRLKRIESLKKQIAKLEKKRFS